MADFREIYFKNIKWSCETFGHQQNLLKLHLKLKEEIDELGYELIKRQIDPIQKIRTMEEISDCFILLQQLMGFTTGYDVGMEVLDRKMEANFNRKFVLQPDGTFKHIKE